MSPSHLGPTKTGQQTFLLGQQPKPGVVGRLASPTVWCERGMSTVPVFLSPTHGWPNENGQALQPHMLSTASLEALVVWTLDD
jgi:hypothetical protein